MREALGTKLVQWGLRLGGGAVIAYLDRVKLANTPTYGHPIYHSPDGRVLVIDPVELTPALRLQMVGVQTGAVKLPKRFVFQLTAMGDPPHRVELPEVEVRRLAASLMVWLGDAQPGDFVIDGQTL